MRNLDWDLKFSHNMSQNMGEGKKVHPEERNLFSFWPINPLFLMEFRKCKKKDFFKATALIKHKIHNLDF